MTGSLSPELGSRLAQIALGHVTREFPHKPGLVLAGPEDARRPASVHPVFFGSFDWHSCVHSYWLLARLKRRSAALPEADAIARLFDAQLVPGKIAGECATFARPEARGFERPYGWAWLLALAGELRRHPDRAWAEALEPLAALIRDRWLRFLPVAAYPTRAGTHGNTAFALRLAAEGADSALLHALQGAVQRWYEADRDCPAWDEPGGEDFLSPALVEAECVRVLLPDAFPAWFDAFLPRLSDRAPATLFRIARATDRSDGKIAHLDGLNFSRAWCMRALAAAVPDAGRRDVLEQAAGAHVAASLPHLATHYMGEHWLASYALLALDDGFTG